MTEILGVKDGPRQLGVFAGAFDPYQEQRAAPTRRMTRSF